MGVKISSFGKIPSGKETALFTLINKNGMCLEVSDYGATLVALRVPGKDCMMTDVVLGYEDAIDYWNNDGYLGATVGRSCNRNGGANVTIQGKTYELPKNERGKNNLHSSPDGYDRMVWNYQIDEEKLSVRFYRMSPDLEQGYPGNFEISVTYTLTEDNAVQIHYYGISDQDTVANMTNHTYFNLSGHQNGTILNHEVWIDADAFTAIDAESIPTGEICSVEGTPFDFRKQKRVGNEIDADHKQLILAGGYDHNFVLNKEKDELKKIAEVFDPESGRKMEVFTTCVGVQFYTGNFITEGVQGKEEAIYHKRSGLCLETQFFPDAVHHANFPSPILKAGEPYDSVTIYKFL